MTGTAQNRSGLDIRLFLWRLIQRVGRKVRKSLVGEPRQPEPIGFELVRPASPDVLVYFPDPAAKLYQLIQWLPVLEALNQRHRVVIVTRRKETFDSLDEHTTLLRAHAPWFRHLSELYEQNDFKVALYVNNGVRNFQSLAHQPMLHVHINHGESDKVCMVSNQVKAYDRVLIAGEAALQRHRSALLAFDESKLVSVGRPQLDYAPESSVPASERRTILYAPTWEGENEANNYTSVDVYGTKIVAAILAQPNVRVIYKPHPRIASTDDEGVHTGHARIMELIETAQSTEPQAGHIIQLKGDVLALLGACDTMITDVSSVALDFLYLNTHRPMFITDRRTDRGLLTHEAPVSQCSHVIDRSALGSLERALAEARVDDSLRAERWRMRKFYFGDGAVGESTERFIAIVDELIKERDALRAEQAARGHVHSHGMADD